MATDPPRTRRSPDRTMPLTYDLEHPSGEDLALRARLRTDAAAAQDGPA